MRELGNAEFAGMKTVAAKAPFTLTLPICGTVSAISRSQFTIGTSGRNNRLVLPPFAVELPTAFAKAYCSGLKSAPKADTGCSELISAHKADAGCSELKSAPKVEIGGIGSPPCSSTIGSCSTVLPFKA